MKDDTSIVVDDFLVQDIAKTLSKQIDKEILKRKYAPAKTVLLLVGAGAFLAASVLMPNLPLALKPFLDHKRKNEYEAWKRFNIPYLKRTLHRLEKEKLVEIGEENGIQVVKISDGGKKKILRFAIDELAVEKPKLWDGRWRIVSYDIPNKRRKISNIFREYLKAWGFYPLHKSVFLHAYPCEKQVEFLREYLGIGEHVRIVNVSQIERDKLFKNFFGI